MGVLSSLAQKLWLQVRELRGFLDGFAATAGGESAGAEVVLPSAGMRFVRIEPGTFRMGQDEGGDFDERPAHTVRITKPFWMSVTEVTNAQYETFDPAHRSYRGRHKLSSGDGEAVVYVSWHDAVRFCAWLSEKEGKPCRLPTEAEWEYACRAGTTTAYHTGDTLPSAFQKRQKQEWSPVAVPLDVGKTPANAWGLHDMHGNVEEWCSDGYGPYEAAEAVDPVGRADGDFKVTRGGSHTTLVEYLRSANRAGALPEDKHWLIGFRVVIGETPATPPLPPPPPPLWARD
ncbi:MAG: formylglycine-generating enzyme family protein, partial [Planctomycetes bacterium]|nr:formylglycine-generating enzyme family protein [Planctomycetota bacterium]